MRATTLGTVKPYFAPKSLSRADELILFMSITQASSPIQRSQPSALSGWMTTGRGQGGELRDRMVREAVCAVEDRVVSEDVDHVQLRERREPDRPTHVVGEDEERAPERYDAAMERHAVQDRPHTVLADAEVNVAPFV